jgi:hypothetical protein
MTHFGRVIGTGKGTALAPAWPACLGAQRARAAKG